LISIPRKTIKKILSLSAAGMTQTEIASRVGVDQKTISNVLRRENRPTKSGRKTITNASQFGEDGIDLDTL
jgi:transcriptional regulator with XRE-family HTH domain